MHGRYMCTSFTQLAHCATGYCDDHSPLVSSLGNLALHDLRIAFQRFETPAAMSHYYFRAKDSWMVASMREASHMYQRAARTFLYIERHTSHCGIQSTGDEGLREHWSATWCLLEVAHQAFLRMSRRGNQTRSSPPLVLCEGKVLCNSS